MSRRNIDRKNMDRLVSHMVGYSGGIRRRSKYKLGSDEYAPSTLHKYVSAGNIELPGDNRRYEKRYEHNSYIDILLAIALLIIWFVF